jgi:hypothetical protein
MLVAFDALQSHAANERLARCDEQDAMLWLYPR